ncbi:hypothetical protein AGR4A_pAt10229 [Agrobacterium tumefaciens str. B6]|uniref:Uncharacterized protein n=1 Tax=Agrobacterium tumefaciens str. B6 TaxID=1183423 RepID=A0A822VCF0_AGRTU|nr:hypothetical protein AGR4A_pAt10229 [Agrobacterium tumefaciens str. B6]SPZ48401.1 Uncharacterised protein [Agrobacterium tumefaciens]
MRTGGAALAWFMEHLGSLLAIAFSSNLHSVRMMAQSMSSAMDGPKALPISVSSYSTFGRTCVFEY